MNPVDVDEESGRVEGVDSFPESEDANNNGGGPKSASAPVVETNFGNNSASTKVRGGGIFSRLFHSDNTDTVENHLDDSQRSSFTPGKWKSLAGSRRIRFASHRSDINNDEMRGIVATPLDSDQCKPMAPGARLLKNIQTEVEDVPQFLRFGSFVDEEGGASSTQQTNQMYRLQATRGAKDVGCCRRTLRFLSACINCGALTESATEQNLYLGFGDPNRWLIYFFFWLFRKGWTTVIFLSIFWYYALVLFFALLIVWASDIDNDCVKVGGNNIGDLEGRSKFVDSFSLSWNTFSTVGYGSTYPALSTETRGSGEGGDPRCAFISFVTSLEAFVGVLFAGFIGAIFFAKVARITQRADVQFSDPLTVRFGTGVDATVLDDDDDSPQDSGEATKTKVKILSPLEKLRMVAKRVSKPSPFPVITFRIANENHGVLGGEIISANVKAVVLIESTRYDDQVDEDLAKQIHLNRMKRTTKDGTPKLRKAASKKAGVSKNSERMTITDRSFIETLSTEDETAMSSHSNRSTDNAISYLQGLNALANRAKSGKKMKVDEEEGTGSKIVPRMVFTTLKLETSEHPLFKRIWRFKHHINQDSPLLTSEAQKAILENGGHWPHEWNNHEAVRKAIRFNQMVVSFTGISNISGASVYKQRVYDYVDTVVGYQFVNALYRGRHGALKVDLRLINDVVEQNGGGGEPLNVATKATH